MISCLLESRLTVVGTVGYKEGVIPSEERDLLLPQGYDV